MDKHIDTQGEPFDFFPPCQTWDWLRTWTNQLEQSKMFKNSTANWVFFFFHNNFSFPSKQLHISIQKQEQDYRLGAIESI